MRRLLFSTLLLLLVSTPTLAQDTYRLEGRHETLGAWAGTLRVETRGRVIRVEQRLSFRQGSGDIVRRGRGYQVPGALTARFTQTRDRAGAAGALTGGASHLLFQGGDDTIVDNRGHDVFAGRAADCTKVTVPGAKHELLLERDAIRSQVLTRIIAFLDRYSL